MPLEPTTITVFLDASPSGQRRADHAAALASRWGAHLVGVHLVFADERMPLSMSFVRGHDAIRQVIDRLDTSAQAAAEIVSAQFQALCTRFDIRGELRAIRREESTEAAITNSLHSDLVVVGHPEPNGLSNDTSVERLLLASGVPLLVVPNAWTGETIGDRILIGWNASREARRAISDAMSFLVAAKSVTVLIIDPAERQRHSVEPGADIGTHLGRHGAHVDIVRVNSQGNPIAKVILHNATMLGSDLLVVGAYSHARLKEILLGGVTRTLLAQMPVPVLVSR